MSNNSLAWKEHEKEHEKKMKKEKGKDKEVENKSISLKASSSKSSNNEKSYCETRDDKTSNDEDTGLFVKRYNRQIWKNGVKQSDKNPIKSRRISNFSKEDENKKDKLRSSFYNYGKVGHYRPDCSMIKKDKDKGHHKTELSLQTELWLVSHVLRPKNDRFSVIDNAEIHHVYILLDKIWINQGNYFVSKMFSIKDYNKGTSFCYVSMISKILNYFNIGILNLQYRSLRLAQEFSQRTLTNMGYFQGGNHRVYYFRMGKNGR